MNACPACGARINDGAYSSGAYAADCQDCGAEICSSCAGLYDSDYNFTGGNYSWCGTARCAPCQKEHEAERASARLAAETRKAADALAARATRALDPREG